MDRSFSFNDDITSGHSTEFTSSDNQSEHELHIDDPELIKEIQQLIRLEEHDGKQVLVVKDYQLYDKLSSIDPESEPDFDDEPDDNQLDFPWNEFDWNDPNSAHSAAVMLAEALTPALWKMPHALGADGDNEIQHFAMTEGIRLAAVRASYAHDLVLLGCLSSYYNMHSKKEREAWRAEICDLLGVVSWGELLVQFPDLPSMERAFDRMGDSRMNQSVPIKSLGLLLRLIPDPNGSAEYDVELEELYDDEDNE